MSYTSKVIPTLGVREGYDRVAGMYHEYWDHLDSFDHAEWRRYLPRTLKGSTILDLGAGDGRTFHRFKNEGFVHYRAADVSEDLLAQHPQQDGVELFVLDLEEERPWATGSVDVVTSFFFLEHIQDLQYLADSVERVLTATGVWIFTYFPQRREFVHGQGQDAFKIELEYHRYEDIEEAMRMAGLEVHYLDISDGDGVIGRAYAGVKG